MEDKAWWVFTLVVGGGASAKRHPPEAPQTPGAQRKKGRHGDNTILWPGPRNRQSPEAVCRPTSDGRYWPTCAPVIKLNTATAKPQSLGAATIKPITAATIKMRGTI